MNRTRCFQAKPIGRFTCILITALIAGLPARGVSQEERATSNIKRPLIYQMGNVIRINAQGPRPLARALEALHERYGWNSDYEDPPYADPAANPSSSEGPGRRQARATNRGNEMFSVDFKVGSEQNSVPNEQDVLTTIVNEYNSRNGDQFELRRQPDGVFAVIGLERGVQPGEPERHTLLDLKISLPAGQRTSAEAIAAICQKINERNNEQTNVAVVPVGTEMDPRLKDTVAVGGTGIAARKLLAQALVTPHGRLNWRMFFEAGGYTLHVFAPSE